MINLSALTNEEYAKICKEIPYTVIINIFKKNPKEFSKIHPGFRANKVKPDDVEKILINNRNNDFIIFYIDKIVSKWLDEIKEAIKSYNDSGETEAASYIHALSRSFFSNNTSAFFKLSENNFTAEQVNVINEAILLLKRDHEESRKIIENLEHNNEELKKNSEKNLKRANDKIKKIELKIEKISPELTALRNKEGQLKKEIKEYEICKEENSKLRKENNSLKNENAGLKKKNQNLSHEKDELRKTIRKEFEEEREKKIISTVYEKPIHPKDIEEFNEFLCYNFDNINVDSQVKNLLSTYLSNILFNGKPIVCDKSVVKTIISCITNTLVNNEQVKELHYFSAVDEQSIHKFIISSGRIVVLDNFLGNYNETILLSVLENHKNKIIFLTSYFQKTLKYLSKELFAYCNYIDVSWLPVFTSGVLSDEDPSIIDEEEYQLSNEFCNGPYAKKLRNILQELGYEDKLINSKVTNINNDQRICEVLAFDVFPYYFNVFNKNPLNYSEKLQRYLKNCPFKDLFERWLNAE